MHRTIKSNKRKKNLFWERINFAFMQKIHLLVKKTQKQGFSHFPNRFPSRVTARKVKIVNNELFLVMIKEMDCWYHSRYAFGSFGESQSFLATLPYRINVGLRLLISEPFSQGYVFI